MAIALLAADGGRRRGGAIVGIRHYPLRRHYLGPAAVLLGYVHLSGGKVDKFGDSEHGTRRVLTIDCDIADHLLLEGALDRRRSRGESEDVKKDTLKDIDSKHEMTVDKKNHPQPPAVKPDTALLVIMCGPPLVPHGVGEGNQVNHSPCGRRRARTAPALGRHSPGQRQPSAMGRRASR